MFNPLISNFRFWPSIFLEVDIFYQLPPIHSGVYRGGGPHDLAIFRQHVLRRDNRFLGRVCWSHARSTSVLQELCKQVHPWHEVCVWDCQLAYLISSHVPKFSLIYQKCVQQRGCSRVLARICLTGIRNSDEHFASTHSAEQAPCNMC